MLSAVFHKHFGTTVDFSFGMLRAVEAILINLDFFLVSEMRFRYEHYYDFFVKGKMSYFQFRLAEAVCIPVIYFELVYLLLRRTYKIGV